MQSYCSCSPDYRPASEAMFGIDPKDPCDGKKDPVSFISLFIRFGILTSFPRQQSTGLGTYLVIYPL